jgi:hydroxyacylglutathione hydrolase
MFFTQLSVGPLQVNCYILADEHTKEAIVIDAGDDAQDILKIIKDNGLKVRYIVITHAHFDHVGANKALKEATGAEILMHQQDEMVLKSVANQGSLFGMRSVASPPADRYVQHGEVITAGDVSLKVLHTPGHSPGGICLLAKGMVFTGDALFAGSIGRTDLPGGDMIALLRGIKEHLMTLPDNTRVYPGHGPASTIGEERRDNPFLNRMAEFA